ncbi:MAG: MFS transporter, partial [Deltaproteobacteria bacterium]|nr:MFS transporter [Deltaproteobacteria bacterium]
AGFLSTVMQLPALLNPYIGSLADRISVRYFIILAPAMTAIPMSLIGVAPSYGVLLILLFIAGISVAVFHVPSPVMISRLSGSKVGLGMSFFMTGGEFARTIGPMVAVGAVSLMGLEGFYPVMVVGILASVWLYLRFRDVPVDKKPSRKTPVGETWKEMQHILIPLSFILIARGFMHASMTAFLPTFIELETGNLWLAGFALTIFEATGVIGVMTAGSLSDYLGRRRVLLMVYNTGDAGTGSGKCQGKPCCRQRFFYDDVFYGAFGRCRSCGLSGRSLWSAHNLFHQCCRRASGDTIYFFPVR